MIVHVLMHDPAVRRCRFFSVGHATGITGHARPEYSIDGDVLTNAGFVTEQGRRVSTWPPTRICLVSAGVKMHFLPAPSSSKDSL